MSDSDIGSSSNDTIWDGVRKIESIPLAELNSFGFNASLQTIEFICTGGIRWH